MSTTIKMRDADESSVSSSVALQQDEELMNSIVEGRTRLTDPPEPLDDGMPVPLPKPLPLPPLSQHRQQSQRRLSGKENTHGETDARASAPFYSGSTRKEDRVSAARLDAIARMYRSHGNTSQSSVTTEEEDDTNYFESNNNNNTRNDIETASATSSGVLENEDKSHHRGRNFLETLAPSNNLTVVMAMVCTMIIVLPVVFSVRNESPVTMSDNSTNSTWGNDTSMIPIMDSFQDNNATVMWRLEEEDGSF